MNTEEAGRMGGLARAKKLTPEQRKQIATKASHARKIMRARRQKKTDLENKS